MKIKLLVVCIAICLVFSGCENSSVKSKTGNNSSSLATVSPAVSSSPTPSVEAYFVDEQKDGKKAWFHLGMDIEEVRKQLEVLHIEVVNEIENTDDSIPDNFGNKSIWTEKGSFTFDKYSKLYLIDSFDQESTTLGLKKGDSLTKVAKLYGKVEAKYTSVEDGDIWEYKQGGDQYLFVYIQNKQVSSWSVSSRSYKMFQPLLTEADVIGAKIKARFMQELRENMAKVEKDPSDLLAAVLASDRIRGLQNLSKVELSQQEIDFEVKAEAKVKPLLNDSVIYTGYSSAGTHLIGILSPFSTENEKFKGAIQSLRKSQDELEFLKAFIDESPEQTLYYGLDLYAEDLMGKKKEIPIQRLFIKNAGEDDAKAVKPLQDEEIQDIMNRYKRSQKSGSSIPNASWHIYGFNLFTIPDPQITVWTDNEPNVLLRQ